VYSTIDLSARRSAQMGIRMNLTRGKKHAVIGLVIFLLFMAVCTVIAKGIYRSGLPQVTVQLPYSSSLIHEIQTVGSVRQGHEYGIFVEEGLRVATVEVRNGQDFEMGSRLFQVDTEDLERIIEEKKLEINKKENIQDENLQIERKREKERELAILRAKEDYENIRKESDLLIEKCQLALEAAQQELSRYDQYLSDISGQDSSVSDGNAYAEQYALQEKRNQLVLSVSTCFQQLEDAKLQKTIKLQEAARAIEDIEWSTMEKDAAMENNALDIVCQKKELQELNILLDADGWVISECAGKVIECRVAVGERTQDNASILYALDNGDRVIEAVFTEQDGSNLILNAEFSMKAILPEGISIKDTVRLVYMEKGENGDILTEMSTENKNLGIGQNVELSYQAQSSLYETCIPVTCICSDEQGGNFVYVVEERKGILGMEWSVRKVFVRILDQTDRIAAIESVEINQNTQVVLYHSGELDEGAVVRILK